MLDAVTIGGKERLRPVLMTTVTTLAGLAPLALSRGEGSEVWQPLGITMIGGLTVSTLVTMLFVPTLYAVAESAVKKDALRKNGGLWKILLEELKMLAGLMTIWVKKIKSEVLKKFRKHPGGEKNV
jgi:HAE1 family hydrophobic/amphiphilic exporter-1